MHNIKFETLISFCMCRAANTTGNHEANGFVCGFCESGILIASVWLRSHKCSLFHLPRKRFQFFPDFFSLNFLWDWKNLFQFLNAAFVNTHTNTRKHVAYSGFVSRLPNRIDFKIKWTLIQFYSVCTFFSFISIALVLFAFARAFLFHFSCGKSVLKREKSSMQKRKTDSSAEYALVGWLEKGLDLKCNVYTCEQTKRILISELPLLLLVPLLLLQAKNREEIKNRARD